MCNLSKSSIIDDDFCEKFDIASKLERLLTKHTTTDQYGGIYVRAQYIENLIKELECSI